MLLRHFALDLEPLEYPDKLYVPFRFQARCLCNFIQQRIRPLRFKVDGVSMAHVRGSRRPRTDARKEVESAATAYVAFDEGRYFQSQGDSRHEFFIDMFERGIEVIARTHAMPMLEVRDAIREFRARGYKNEWVYKTKLLRPYGVRATLRCALTMEEFVLTLEVVGAGETIFKDDILRTKPDEIIFAHQFKDLIVRGDKLIVVEKRGAHLFKLPLSRRAQAGSRNARSATGRGDA